MHEINNGVFKSDISDNIYVIGDIHGDYQCLIHCLVDLCESCHISKIYNDELFNTDNREYLEWIPNNKAIIIFCGDMIHRKRCNNVLDDECSDIFILLTLIRLKEEAILNGGNVILISGNHEIMNISQPENIMYISPKNIETNLKYFNDKNFVNKYIKNSYAWIKLDNILITHAGLCSEYLDNDEFEKYSINKINDEYHKCFTNLKHFDDKKNLSYSLFIKYDIHNHKTHNMFWCREWGYGEIECEKLKILLNKIKCKKMIISHCPQFINPNKPQMINFECNCGEKENGEYLLARIDLGMSRCFDYNDETSFIPNLSKNHYRKMAILKLKNNNNDSNNNNNNELYFNHSCVITKKISCMQYLLLKYGYYKKDWHKHGINSNWMGFRYINSIENIKKCSNDEQDGICCVINTVLKYDTKCKSILYYMNLLDELNGIDE